MKLTSLLKFIVIMLILSFISLYLTTAGGYYEQTLSNKNILTEEAIKRFESDVAAGKEIVASNYIVKQKDYSNAANKFANKLSNIIANTYDKMMRFIFKQIESTMSN